MSVRIPTNDGPPTPARRGDDPRAQRRGRFVAVSVMVVLLSLSAVPIADSRASNAATRQVEALETELLALRDAARKLETRAVNLAAGTPLDDDRIDSWFAPVDPLRIRNTLLQAARALRLDVHSVDVEHAEGHGGGFGNDTVLGFDGGDVGVNANGDTPARARTASTFHIAGAGRPSQVLLFCAMLAGLESPLRLERVNLLMNGARAAFEVEARRLELPSTANPASPPLVDAS